MAFTSFYSANNSNATNQSTYVLSGNGTSLIVELWGEGADGGTASAGVNGGFTNAVGGPIVGTLTAAGGIGGHARSSGASSGGAGGAAGSTGDVNTVGNTGGAGNGSNSGDGGNGPNGVSISGVGSGGLGESILNGLTGPGRAPGGGYGGSSIAAGCVDKYAGGGGSGAYTKKTYSSGLNGTITLTWQNLITFTGAACFTLDTGTPPPNTTGSVIINTIF